MTDGLTAGECARCGQVTFPRRLWCPTCGGADFRPRAVDAGTVEHATTVRHAAGRADWVPVELGAVRLDDGAIMIARLEPGVAPGQQVRLRGGDAAPVAGPLVDQPPR